MPEPPLKICATCRGLAGDDACPDCNGVGVGIPLDWLDERRNEFEIVTDEDGRRWAQPREFPLRPV